MPYGYDTNPPVYPIYSEWASDFLSKNNTAPKSGTYFLTVTKRFEKFVKVVNIMIAPPPQTQTAPHQTSPNQ